MIRYATMPGGARSIALEPSTCMQARASLCRERLQPPLVDAVGHAEILLPRAFGALHALGGAVLLPVDADRAELARAGNDPVARGLARRAVMRERRLDAIVIAQRIGKASGVERGFCHARADMRPRHERRISHDDRAPEHKLRRREVVDRLEIWTRCGE